MNVTLEAFSDISLFLFLFCSVKLGPLSVLGVLICAISKLGKRI